MLQRGWQLRQLKVDAIHECRIAYRLQSLGQVDAFDFCFAESTVANSLDGFGQNHLTAAL